MKQTTIYMTINKKLGYDRYSLSNAEITLSSVRIFFMVVAYVYGTEFTSLVLYQKNFRTLCTDRTCASPSYRKVRRNVMNTVERSLAHFFEQLSNMQ